MLRNLLGWVFCLIALLMGAALLHLLATPRALAPAPISSTWTSCPRR